MLARVDRVQVVVSDRSAAAAAFHRLLDAAVAREDRIRLLGARRTVLRLGSSEVELLEPDGTGLAADFLSTTHGGLFAAGFTTPDVARLRAHLRARGIAFEEEESQLLLAPQALRQPGFRAVISAAAELPANGLVQSLYEATLLVQDFAAVVRAAASTFALDASHFVPIRSHEFGYEGVLTLFGPDRLDRIEIITPTDAAKTMGRFFARRGPSWYMCFAEAADLRPLRARLLEYAPHDWTGPRAGIPDSLFIHPKALGGMMLGVSRTTHAWTWSGHPERVVAAGEA
jgi:glyoxalase/bleomycin resistance protein/dioxygenase superfamily protein